MADEENGEQLDLVEIEAGLDEIVPYWRAQELIHGAWELHQKGEKDAAFVMLNQALHQTIISGTDYIDDLRSRVAELESSRGSTEP